MYFRTGLVRFEAGISSDFVCASVRSLYYFRGFMICQCSFATHFGVSTWHLKCAKHGGCNSDVVQ